MFYPHSARKLWLDVVECEETKVTGETNEGAWLSHSPVWGLLFDKQYKIAVPSSLDGKRMSVENT